MKIHKRDMYAVVAGQYGGDFLVFTSDNPEGGSYKTIVLPDIIIRYIKEKDIKQGIKLGILDKVENIKRFVFRDLLEQVKIKEQKELEQRTEAINEYYDRRQQFTSQDILDSEK